MTTPNDQVLALETLLKASAIPIAEVLAAANVNRSMWTRWKQGRVPRLDSWMRVNAAADARLEKVANAVSVPWEE